MAGHEKINPRFPCGNIPAVGMKYENMPVPSVDTKSACSLISSFIFCHQRELSMPREMTVSGGH